eukprot:g8138.t1
MRQEGGFTVWLASLQEVVVAIPMVVCLACGGPGPPFRCSGCRVACFCSKDCQRSAAVAHRPFCRWPEIPEAEGWTSDDLTEIWLQRLGLGEDGRVLGQRPLQEDEAWDLITSQQRLAPRFFGRNRFDGLLSVLRAWTSQSRWPLVMSARSQAHLTELPTLELCACLVWRVLSCAKQLRQQGHKRLIFLSIGAGDALVEACVALHLAAALGVPVLPVQLLSRPFNTFQQSLLAQEEPRLKYGDFEISVVATDSDQDEVLRQNRVAEAPRELPVRRLDRRRAVRSASDLGPVYVFSSWMPMHACWCSDVLEDAGTQLVEMCFLSAPPELIQEVFPKTLCRWDFLAQGFEEGAGLFHSQLYVTSAKTIAAFSPLPRLGHGMGCYKRRMDASEELTAVNVCRGVGLFHDLSAPVPPPHLASLKTAAAEPGVKERFAECVKFLRGVARRQILEALGM